MSVQLNDKISYGTMSLTWRPEPMSPDDAAEMIHYVVSKHGVKFLNGGEFYGPDNANLKAFQRYFEKYNSPKNKELVVSIKGALDPKTLSPDGSKESIDKSVKNVLAHFPLENRPKILFETARVDKNIPIETTLSYINEYIQQGLLSGVSLSETGGKTVLKALKVANISCVELELSFFTRDILEDGVLKVCSDNNIPIIAYSPVCRGMLTDYAVEHADELYEATRKDMRSWMDRFSEENYRANIAACKKLYDFAHDVKKTSLEALALSWILKVSEAKNLWGIEKVCKIIPIPSGSTKEKADMNFGHLVEITDAEFEELEKIYESTRLQGGRANAHLISNMLV
ncbi:hypothetical protein PGUG_01740 [Meyerozyma guilliermondii ATCC 6260]|uniref:NADP-dependent oxidoreductase domain-containing protein n=1 Tax=Meyerozyma guilliermondii (strain ATCC 6260 / CBS 566 / DSM 6381 / JCM 1539 / NBRC 10279 / NRRL Y-324) TaxID=294746 RepID=A5DEN9_PICGU|nr:uncharacterized protein PGUG_01740 [Meyerozyma guilliermondii ATCC 6260]EDK37642.2 hypothetical protein PGUG_01740 [Meyerozyma guilliermondii ATCC 6260]